MPSISRRRTSGKKSASIMSQEEWRAANSRIVVKSEQGADPTLLNVWAEDSESGELLVFRLITWER
jgi:rRNA maturation protein Rpf1